MNNIKVKVYKKVLREVAESMKELKALQITDNN